MPTEKTKAFLILEDGTVIQGSGFGADATVSGEVVFNTGMVGYPETLTDPSYYGQILVQTWPLVGNYGVARRDITDEFGLPLHFESSRVQAQGYAVSEVQGFASHWSSLTTVSEWLREDGVPGISGIDTRELTKKLRTKGTMLGLLASGPGLDLQNLLDSAKSLSDPNSDDLVRRVSVPSSKDFRGRGGPRIVVIDCGVKFGIVRNLLARGFDVTLVPYDTAAARILALEPSGVVISNGPGDPVMCGKTVKAVSAILETEVPVFGICLGTQILALAGGGSTYKLKFGHRAQNHPCADLKTGKVYLTTQNHGYTVDAKSLQDFDVSFVNLNDRTVEGIRHVRKQVMGVQFHPEASPGPYETGFMFDEFGGWVRRFQGAKA